MIAQRIIEKAEKSIGATGIDIGAAFSWVTLIDI